MSKKVFLNRFFVSLCQKSSFSRPIRLVVFVSYASESPQRIEVNSMTYLYPKIIAQWICYQKQDWNENWHLSRLNWVTSDDNICASIRSQSVSKVTRNRDKSMLVRLDRNSIAPTENINRTRWTNSTFNAFLIDWKWIIEVKCVHLSVWQILCV